MVILLKNNEQIQANEQEALVYIQVNGTAQIQGFLGEDAERTAYLAGRMVQGFDLDEEIEALGSKSVLQHLTDKGEVGRIVEERRNKITGKLDRWVNGEKVERNESKFSR